MATTGYTEMDGMLALALLGYRGFALPPYLPAAVKGERLGRAIREGLGTLGPVKDRWDLVWGPASFRAPFTLFDEALAYVARSRGAGERVVVAIRGTNPISAWDWVFGDLAVERAEPWPWGPDPGAARVSFSTHLGLRILQSLRHEAAPASLAARLVDTLDRAIAEPLRRGAESLLRRLPAELGGELRALRGELRRSLESLRSTREQLEPGSLAEWARALDEGPLARPREEALAALDRLAGAVRTHAPVDPLRLLLGGSELRMRAARRGTSLKELLASLVASSPGGLDIALTGHSKGGALAVATALWLADTQGDAGPGDERWDPEGRARLHVWSFAGPTAGNAAFAARFGTCLGDRGHRIWNRLDIVPHAFDVRDLAAVPDLYPCITALEREVLAGLAKRLADRVRGLDYRHVPGDVVELPGRLAPGAPLFFEQAVHQHLDGYLEQLGLAGEMSLGTFFRLAD